MPEIHSLIEITRYGNTWQGIDESVTRLPRHCLRQANRVSRGCRKGRLCCWFIQPVVVPVTDHTGFLTYSKYQNTVAELTGKSLIKNMVIILESPAGKGKGVAVWIWCQYSKLIHIFWTYLVISFISLLPNYPLHLLSIHLRIGFWRISLTLWMWHSNVQNMTARFQVLPFPACHGRGAGAACYSLPAGLDVAAFSEQPVRGRGYLHTNRQDEGLT